MKNISIRFIYCIYLSASICISAFLQSLKSQPIAVSGEGQVAKLVADLAQPGRAYYIKNKATQRIITAFNWSNSTGHEVLPANPEGTVTQKFAFDRAPDPGYFFIRTLTRGNYLSLLRTDAGGGTVNYRLIEDQVYSASSGNKVADTQKWKIVLSDDPNCVLISNKISNELLLRDDESNHLKMTSQNPRAREMWVLKITTAEGNPNSDDADRGLNMNCTATLDVKWWLVKLTSMGLPIVKVLPQWRGVGDRGTQREAISSYRVLEGVVNTNNTEVSFEDMPFTHFTHDFYFHVNPDPPFRYLLGVQNGRVQEDMEVEWESGIGQNDNEEENPAVPHNIRGDSYGFYTAGHKSRDEIWNWPTRYDWVHVEGQWIWDRGHPPAHTEIHPPRVVAIQRNLPDKFEPSSGTYFFATRCDVYANGDGNVMWNNKGVHSFAKKVEMSDRDYVIVFRHSIKRPTTTARLKAVWKNQSGNTFSKQPAVAIYENGTADIPEPHVVVTLPWKSENVQDNAVFAKTLFLYWDDFASHGIPSNYRMKTVEVKINKVTILDKEEGDDADPGEYRLFVDVGGKWLFLNEYTGANNILTHGLGRVWDTKYSLLHPFIHQPGDAANNFTFSQSFYLYVPEGKKFRIHFSGWEADYANGRFGRIIDPYMACERAKQWVESRVNGMDLYRQGCLDDPIGHVSVNLSYHDINTRQYNLKSTGQRNEEPGQCPDSNPNESFQAFFQIIMR